MTQVIDNQALIDIMNITQENIGICPTERAFDILLASGSWQVVSESQLAEIRDEDLVYCTPRGGYIGPATDDIDSW